MGEEGMYEKLLCDDNMKAAEEDDAGEYVDDNEKRMKIGRMQGLFYVFGTIVLLQMSVFSLCLGATVIAIAPGHEFDWFKFPTFMFFLWTSQLGGTLLCETISSLNVSTLPEMIDFGGALACGLFTWGFYYASQLCLSIISENTPPGRKLVTAVYMINGAYVFMIVSGVLFFGFFLISCHRCFIICYRNGAVPVERINAHPRRGRIAADIYRFLIMAIFIIILPLLRLKDNLVSGSG